MVVWRDDNVYIQALVSARTLVGAICLVVLEPESVVQLAARWHPRVA